MLFWFLLLGSWQFLSSPRKGAPMIGATGTACFLVFAWKSLGRLRGFGMHHACWKPARRTDWVIAVATGFAAGTVIFEIGFASGQKMILSADWRLVLLQVALGPVLEEIVFRGYLFAALIWSFRRFAGHVLPNWAVIVIAALVFALVHLAQPGVKWLELACIASTGTLYGWVRCRSGSTAPAAISHAAYNLTLYAAVKILAAGR
jgi:membrane protease YdiL (CAAX protease family)